MSARDDVNLAMVALGACVLLACSNAPASPVVDASTYVRADAQGVDAEDAGTDASQCASPLPATLTCDAPLAGHCLPEGCPPSSWNDLDAWCDAHHGARLLAPCGGYFIYSEAVGADGSYTYLYDATTKQLSAILSDENAMFWQCQGGAPSFSMSTADCFVETFAFGPCEWALVPGGSWVFCSSPTDAGADADADAASVSDAASE